MSIQQFCLRWNNHQPNFISVFTNLLLSESLVDVTLAAEGKHLQAHRVVLSACSSYFQSLFTINPCQHPIVILKDVKYNDLKIMVDFMYYGEVNVSQEQLPAILKTAEMLKIKGLADTDQHISGTVHMMKSESASSDKADLLTPGDSTWGSDSARRSPSPMSPSMRRKRFRKSSTGSGSGSTERTSEEVTSEMSLAPSLVKPEPVSYTPEAESGGRSDSSLRNSTQEPSTDSEPREGSQDSTEDDPLSMQMSHESSVGVETQIADTGPGPSTSQQSMASQACVTSNKPGKRGRPLIRQPRVKKESDPVHTSPDSEHGSPPFTSGSLLTVPNVPNVRVERPYSDPPPISSTPNLLTVPQPAYLVKQHSDPIPPTHHSSTPQPQTTLVVQRQLSQPNPGQTCVVPPPPFHVHLVTEAHHQPTASKPTESTVRTISPSVVIEPLPVLRVITDHGTETGKSSHSSGLRIRTDELRRASSSPQASSPRESYEPLRSGHCPVLRPGPALGCNFCWNTIDNHGRILRRKTKYHCPECQTNLCIVPCFQEYHERHTATDKESSGSMTILKVLPKTSSI
ncbi:hypothetical protein R5R35_008844 [Gryllus longicercus]|uniref:BTB domain-containing protein n=1 Tax=Gryllus longicercus TaxID=2509291 RepID=A0AAN9V1M1_9ORTH